jgi:hypothetical protein
MMKCIVRFFDNAKRVINESLKSDRKITWALIYASIEKEYLELSQMKFKDPSLPVPEFDTYFNNLCEDIDSEFRKLLLAP